SLSQRDELVYETVRSKASQLAKSIDVGLRSWRGKQYEEVFDSSTAVRNLCRFKICADVAEALDTMQAMLSFGFIERMSKRSDQVTGLSWRHATLVKISYHTFYRFNLREIGKWQLYVEVLGVRGVAEGANATVTLAAAGQSRSVALRPASGSDALVPASPDGDRFVCGFEDEYFGSDVPSRRQLHVRIQVSNAEVASHSFDLDLIDDISRMPGWRDNDEDDVDGSRLPALVARSLRDIDMLAKTGPERWYSVSSVLARRRSFPLVKPLVPATRATTAQDEDQEDPTGRVKVWLGVFALRNDTQRRETRPRVARDIETRAWRVYVRVNEVRGAHCRVPIIMRSQVVLQVGAKVKWKQAHRFLKIPVVESKSTLFTGPRRKDYQKDGADFDGARLVVTATAPRQHGVLRVSVYERLKTDLTRTRRLGVATVPLAEVPIVPPRPSIESAAEAVQMVFDEPAPRTLELRTSHGTRNGTLSCTVWMAPVIADAPPLFLQTIVKYRTILVVALAALFIVLAHTLPRGFLDALLVYAPLIAVKLYIEAPRLMGTALTRLIDVAAPGLHLTLGAVRVALWFGPERTNAMSQMHTTRLGRLSSGAPQRLTLCIDVDDVAIAHPPDAGFEHEDFFSAKAVRLQLSADRRLLWGLANIAVGSRYFGWRPFPSLHDKLRDHPNFEAARLGVIRIDELKIDDVKLVFEIARGELNVCRLTRMLAQNTVQKALRRDDAMPNTLSIDVVSTANIRTTAPLLFVVVSVRNFERQTAMQSSRGSTNIWDEHFVLPTDSHRARAFVVHGTMLLRDKAFAAFPRSRSKRPTIELRIAYYHEVGAATQEQLLTVYRPLTALAQLQINSLETTRKLGEYRLVKNMLQDFPVLFDPRTILVTHINCSVMDLFAGYRGAGEHHNALFQRRLIKTFGDFHGERNDSVEAQEAPTVDNDDDQDRRRSSFLKRLKKSANIYRLMIAFSTPKSFRTRHHDPTRRKDKHVYLRRLDLSSKLQHRAEGNNEGLDLFTVAKSLSMSAIMPILKEVDLVGGVSHILAGLFSRVSLEETDLTSNRRDKARAKRSSISMVIANKLTRDSSLPSDDCLVARSTIEGVLAMSVSNTFSIMRSVFGSSDTNIVWAELRRRTIVYSRRDPVSGDTVGLKKKLKLDNPRSMARYDRAAGEITLRFRRHRKRSWVSRKKEVADIRLRAQDSLHPGFPSTKAYMECWWTFIARSCGVRVLVIFLAFVDDGDDADPQAQTTSDEGGNWVNIADLEPIEDRARAFTVGKSAVLAVPRSREEVKSEYINAS
ncbi:hypothetical protein CTAYLR_000320, partial [Chrysophaeum taylorii]